MKIPPFIATLGMMLILKGLSLVISGTKPIYFNDTPSFPLLSTGSLIGAVIPAVPLPNGVLILFVLALVISWVLNRTMLGPLLLCAWLERRGRAPVGRERRWLEGGDLRAGGRHLRHRGPADRLAPELGAAGAGPGL